MFVSDTELLLNTRYSDAVPYPEHLPRGLTVRTIHDSATRLDYLQTDMDDWTEEQFHRYLELLSQIISRCETDLNGWQYVPANYTPFGRLYRARVATNEAIDRNWLREAIALVKDLPTIPQDRNTNMQTQRKECIVQPGLMLIRTTAGHSVHDFKVIDAAGNDFDIAGASCADWDQSGRLVYTRDGKVFAGEVTAIGIAEHELADFNGNKFEPIDSPDWAKSW